MPARLQSQHIHRHFLLPETVRSFPDCFLVAASVGTVPHPQSPHGRQAASSREKIVSLHYLFHIARKNIKIHALHGFQVNNNGAPFHISLQGIERRLREFLMGPVHLRAMGGAPLLKAGSHIKFRMTEGIHKQAVPRRGYVKGRRSMAFPRICRRVGVYTQQPLSPCLVHAPQLQPEAIDVLIAVHGQHNLQASGVSAEGNALRRRRQFRLSQKLQRFLPHGKFPQAYGSMRLRHAYGSFPYTVCN